MNWMKSFPALSCDGSAVRRADVAKCGDSKKESTLIEYFEVSWWWIAEEEIFHQATIVVAAEDPDGVVGLDACFAFVEESDCCCVPSVVDVVVVRLWLGKGTKGESRDESEPL